MKLVIDTNILISAMMSPAGRVADVLFSRLTSSELFAPHFLIVELFDKKERILRYTKLPAADVSELYYQLLKRIIFINEELIDTHALQQGYELVRDVDLKDLPFVALSLHLDASLWTGDHTLANGLRAKGFIRCLTTADLDVS